MYQTNQKIFFHYGNTVEKLLQNHRRWIGRREPIPWLVESSDITFMYFYVWGQNLRIRRRPGPKYQITEATTNNWVIENKKDLCSCKK